MNSVPLRVTLPSAGTARATLDEVRAATLGAVEHQAMPFERLVDQLRPARSGEAREPWFATWFAFEDDTGLERALDDDVALADFRSMPIGLSTGTAKSDVAWVLVDRGEEYVLSLGYRSSRYDHATAENLTTEYARLLEDVVTELDHGTAPVPDDDGVEDGVLAIWRATFGDADLGPDDDFFVLGGYSMLAVEIVGAVEERFGAAVSFVDFFEAPTVSGLAAAVRAAGHGSTDAPAVPAVRTAEDQSLEDILAELERESADLSR